MSVWLWALLVIWMGCLIVSLSIVLYDLWRWPCESVHHETRREYLDRVLDEWMRDRFGPRRRFTEREGRRW